MSEKNLNAVIRQLDKAIADLNYARDLAGETLRNYNVATHINCLKGSVADYTQELDTEYRKSHYTGKRR